MNCYEDNLAIYDEYDSYIFNREEFKVVTTRESEIGKSDFAFQIEISDPKIVTKFVRPRISFCKNNTEFIGRGNPNISSNLPAACHFYFKYNDEGKLSLKNEKQLTCFSTKYLTLEQYAKEVLGIKK